MLLFFSILAGITVALLAATLYHVYFVTDLLTHFFFGLACTGSVLITHCWVFFYFIGTGQGIREGVLQHGLDTKAIKKTKRFKAKTFPFALFSMGFAIVAAIMGGAARTDKLSSSWHLILIVVTVLFNLFAFTQEWRTIRQNQRLMRELNALIGYER